MLKKIKDLDKDEQLLLLHAIANDEVYPERYDEDTLCACSYTDCFLGLMVCADSPGETIILLGESRKARDLMLKH